MNRQDGYRQKYAELKPGWKDSQTLYRELLEGMICPDIRVLDIGCGHSEFLTKAYSQSNHTYGVDLDASALQKNTLIQNKFVASGENLPFDDNFFDLVVSAWVLEHVEDPEKFFREVHRVLKPEGKVIFLTPNTWNYNVWIIRAIPNRLHDFLTRRLYGREEGDTFPVRYRINSARRIRRLLPALGFKEEKLILNGDPTYISFNRPLFWVARLVERLLDSKVMRNWRVHIIGVFTKK